MKLFKRPDVNDARPFSRRINRDFHGDRIPALTVAHR
jgi:hypothetical protein